ncbi:MAG: HAMP domain-containing sensor histidine kinase [Ilumatobacteraceae bacterium]
MTLSRRISLVTSLIIAVTTSLFAALAAFSSRNAALDAIDRRNFELRRTISNDDEPVSALLQSIESTSADFVAFLIVAGEDPISLLESESSAPLTPSPTSEQLISAQLEPLTIDSTNPVRVVALNLGDEQWLMFGDGIDDVRDQFERQLLTNALIALLLTIVGGGVIALLARRSLQPIERIVAFSKRVASGDLTTSLEVNSPSLEVRELQASIAGMVESLKAAADSRARSESSMREFLADVAHELRTPLPTVRAYAALLATATTTDPETRTRAQDRIARESKRMSRLIDDLLLLARLSSIQPEQTERVNIGEIVMSHADDLRMLDPSRPIMMTCDSFTLTANRGLIERMVSNIFSNIHRHTPPTTPVEVRCERLGGFANITIDDGGPGLEPTQLEQLAHGPRRFGLLRSSDQHATGLGLHLLATIAQSHGGEARFTPSRLGGLSVTVRLPISAPNVRAETSGYGDCLESIE